MHNPDTWVFKRVIIIIIGMYKETQADGLCKITELFNLQVGYLFRKNKKTWAKDRTCINGTQ